MIIEMIIDQQCNWEAVWDKEKDGRTKAKMCREQKAINPEYLLYTEFLQAC
jgi:hypothetical protein